MPALHKKVTSSDIHFLSCASVGNQTMFSILWEKSEVREGHGMEACIIPRVRFASPGLQN